MTYPSHDDDMAGNAIALLPSQFEISENLQALITALVGGDGAGLQETEDALWALLTSRALSVATGQLLEDIGQHLGLPRTYIADESYRADLYMQVAINSSIGQTERLIDICRRITSAEFIEYTQRQPATALLYSHRPGRISLLHKVQQAATGGVKVVATGSVDPDPFVFGVDRDAAGDGHGEELDYGDGWGEVSYPAEGGCFTEVFDTGD